MTTRRQVAGGTFNNNAVGSWRLDLDYAHDPAAMEESSSDEEGAEDHEASDNSEEEEPSCGDEEGDEEDYEKEGLPRRSTATEFSILPLGLDAF